MRDDSSKISFAGGASAQDKDTNNVLFNKDLSPLTSGVNKLSEESIQSIRDIQFKKEFPVDAFPSFYIGLINQFREVSGFEKSYAGISMLAAFASVIGNSIRIKPKKSWIEPCILYCGFIGNSSKKKTPILSKILSPFYSLESEYHREYKREYEEWELSEKRGKKPIRKHIIFSDSTPESIIQMHETNPKGLLYHNDELMSMVNRFGQYRSGPDVEFWLSIWSGETIKVTRKGQETVQIDKPCISTIGGIQPQIMQALNKKNMSLNGFTYRILFAVPEFTGMDEWNEEEMNESDLKRMHQIIKELHLKFDKHIEPIDITFSHEAKPIWVDWYNKNRGIVNYSKDDSLISIYSKLPGYLARIALVLEVMYSVENQREITSVSLEAMEGAVKLIEYFRHTSEYAHSIIYEGSFIDSKDKEIYKAVNDEFTTADIIEAGEMFSIPKDTVKQKVIPRFILEKKIERIIKGHYRKLTPF